MTKQWTPNPWISFDLLPALLPKAQPFPPGAKRSPLPRPVFAQSCCHSCWERRYQRSSLSKLLRKRHNWCFYNSQNSPSEPWNQLWKTSGSSVCLWSNFKIHYFIFICSNTLIGRWLWWSSWARRLRLCPASLCRGFHPFPHSSTCYCSWVGYFQSISCHFPPITPFSPFILRFGDCSSLGSFSWLQSLTPRWKHDKARRCSTAGHQVVEFWAGFLIPFIKLPQSLKFSAKWSLPRNQEVPEINSVS